MNEFNTNANLITNPQEAVEQFVGEQFIEWLMEYIPHEMRTWPVIQRILASRPKPEKIKKFMLQRFLAAEAYLGQREGDPGFLRFAIANLSESDDPEAESALQILEEKRQERLTGHKIEKGIIHTTQRELWIRLLKSLGFTDEEIAKAEPKEITRNYIADLSEIFSNLEWQTAVGAFAGFERALAEENKVLLEILKNSMSLTEKDLEILVQPLESTHILDKIVFDLEGKQLVWAGIQKQLDIHQEFLIGLSKYLIDH